MIRALIILLSVVTVNCTAQSVVNPDSVICQKDFGYLCLANLYSDSTISCDVVLIRTEVKPHIHHHHSETAYVLEGAGKLLLGDSVITVKQGDMIFIPAGKIHAFRLTSEIPARIITIHTPNYDGKDREEVDLKW